jgi:hypothetical protein
MVLIILTIQHMKNISVSNMSLCLRKAFCDRELRQGWERQPPQAQTDVEQAAEAIQPPHAVAEHGFAARDYKRKACYGSGGIVRRRRSRPKS